MRSSSAAFFTVATLCALSGFGCGCSTLRYLSQATFGQLELSNRARPITETVRDERTPPRISKLLEEIPTIKSYGESKGIKPTANYTDYVQLDRPAAVWVVSAAEKLRFASKTWNFPVVGSFPYLGWFDLDAAKKFAAGLREEGWDVDVRGAGAYSTLGWFKDAVLSSMIPEGEEARGDLVNVILHESVHATLYVSGQAYFNESIASWVADRLTTEYLSAHGGKESGELAAYEKAQRDGDSRRKDLHDAYVELARLYESKASDTEKDERKAKLLSALREKLGFKRDLNNATLIQFKTYDTGTPEFDELFKACANDWSRFWSVLKPLKSEDFGAPQTEKIGATLKRLAQAGCR